MAAEDFLDAARALLAQWGCDAVSAVGLCSALGVTKGSFQHHFAGTDDFVRKLTGRWESDRMSWLAECAAARSAGSRLERLCLPMLGRPDPAETAWHAWAWSNPVVGRAVERFETGWERSVAQALADLGHDPETASLLAQAHVAFAVGLRQRRPSLPPEWTRAVVLEWLRRGLGLQATATGARLSITGPAGPRPTAPSRKAVPVPAGCSS